MTIPFAIFTRWAQVALLVLLVASSCLIAEEPAVKPADGEKPKAAEDEPKPKPKKKDPLGEEKKVEVPDPTGEIPPPPVPTPEEITKRNERAVEYQSLGEKFFHAPVTGTILNKYRLRTGGGERDDDISQYVTVDYGEKARDMATAHFDASVNENLNKHGKGRRSDLFSGLLDTYNSPVNARVYSAYVDLNKVPGLELLRIGRQWNYDTPEILQFDGVRVDTKVHEELANLQLSFYVGVPIHHFEPSAHGDWLTGMSAESQPWESLKLRFDYIHINDDFTDWKPSSTDPLYQGLKPNSGVRSDDLMSISFWQKFKDPNIRVNGHLSVVDGMARDAQVRATYSNAPCGLQVSGSYSIWFRPQTQFVTEFDPYFETLRGLDPYQTGNVTVTKTWLPWLQTDFNATSRRLIDGAEARQFNREFDRFYFTLQTRDALKKGLCLSLTASRWNGLGSAPDTTQVGAEASYKWKKGMETTAGTDYALYKYDFFSAVERDDVRSYYLRQRWKPTKWASLDARYNFEQARGINYHTATLQFKFDF